MIDRLTAGLRSLLLFSTFAAALTLSTATATLAQSAPDPSATPAMTSTLPAAPDSAVSALSSYGIQVDGARQWTDTMIDLRGGEKIRLTAEGSITYKTKKKTFGPAGIPRSMADLIHEYAVPNGGHGELIARVGTADTAEAFEVGEGITYSVPVAGRLLLGINQSMKDCEEATGIFQVKIEVLTQGTDVAVGGPLEAAIPGVTPDLLESIPRRVSDDKHNPGDMVNVLLIGEEADVVKVFTTAGWVKVDKSVGNTIEAGLIDTLEKKDYLTMPMSTLYLFERPQDYGFAHGEPVRVVMSRNHLRVWKSPYQVNGRRLWCVAATHDIGFERDQRNNGVTHKIDPAIDGEREYVNDTLSATGLVMARNHVTPVNPLTTAKTATGGEFHSDGRILVLALKSGD